MKIFAIKYNAFHQEFEVYPVLNGDANDSSKGDCGPRLASFSSAADAQVYTAMLASPTGDIRLIYQTLEEQRS